MRDTLSNRDDPNRRFLLFQVLFQSFTLYSDCLRDTLVGFLATFRLSFRIRFESLSISLLSHFWTISRINTEHFRIKRRILLPENCQVLEFLIYTLISYVDFVLIFKQISEQSHSAGFLTEQRWKKIQLEKRICSENKNENFPGTSLGGRRATSAVPGAESTNR